MNIIFAGTPAFAAVALQSILDKDAIKVKAVYTQPDRPAGRGQKLTASAVKQLAQVHDLPVLQPLHFKQNTLEGEAARAELQQLCKQHAVDVMVVAAYGLILPQAVLDMPKQGCLNIHASLLPRWRGAAPIQRAILAGDPETGITIMQMAKGLDTGDMLYKVTTPITAADTAQTLHDRLAQLGGEAIVQVLSGLLSYQAQAEQQDDALAVYAHKLEKAEGLIDWTQPATAIDRQIRGLSGWPVAYTTLNRETIRIHTAALQQTSTAATQPGTILAIGAQAVAVACGSSGEEVVALTQLQFPGGKALTASQVAAGGRLSTLQVFGT